ncbi:MAG: cytochrome c3 family protein [Bryobacteraceae bacterium]
MAHALQPAPDSAILKHHPVLHLRANGYEYDLRRDGDTIRYTVQDGKDRAHTFSAILPWAFGLGSAGQTYLYKNGGSWYEARVSYYSAANGLDVTIGHRTLPVQGLNEAAGRQLQKAEADRCFGCHAGGTPQAIVPGINCERCHENAGQHARSFTDRKVAPIVPEKLGSFDAEQMADFCGSCHRTWQEIAANGPHDINNVRLQPYRLVSSKCYEASLLDKRLSCVACHDPHREIERAAGFYDNKCTVCHQSGASAAHACPKGNRECVSCHMPKIELPEAHFRFTDHRIRIVHPGAPYPN